MSSEPDTLFLACCRPSMFLGIPLAAYASLLVVCGEYFVLTGLGGPGLHRIISTLVVSILGYSICRMLTAWDHNIFSIVWLWFTTKVRTLPNWAFWSGSSVSPFPARQPKKVGDLQYHA